MNRLGFVKKLKQEFVESRGCSYNGKFQLSITWKLDWTELEARSVGVSAPGLYVLGSRAHTYLIFLSLHCNIWVHPLFQCFGSPHSSKAYGDENATRIHRFNQLNQVNKYLCQCVYCMFVTFDERKLLSTGKIYPRRPFTFLWMCQNRVFFTVTT